MLEDYVEATKGPNDKPGVVIIHVEACDHLPRVLGRIKTAGGALIAQPTRTSFYGVKCPGHGRSCAYYDSQSGFGGQVYIPTMINKIQGSFHHRRTWLDVTLKRRHEADWTIAACAGRC